MPGGTGREEEGTALPSDPSEKPPGGISSELHTLQESVMADQGSHILCLYYSIHLGQPPALLSSSSDEDYFRCTTFAPRSTTLGLGFAGLDYLHPSKTRLFPLS